MLAIRGRRGIRHILDVSGMERLIKAETLVSSSAPDDHSEPWILEIYGC